MNELFKLALQYNLNDRTRALLTILTVSVATFLVLTILIITQTGVNYFFSELLTFQPDQIVILPVSIQGGGAASGIKFFDSKDLVAINSLKCINLLYPVMIFRGDYAYKNKSGFASIVGSDYYLEDNQLYISLKEGRRIERGSKREVVVGYKIWKSTDVKLGDSIVIENRTFRVVGILDKSTFQSTDDQLFVSLSDAKEMFGNKFSSMVGRFDLSCNETQLVKDIESILKRRDRDVTVISSQFIRENIGSVLNTISLASVLLSFVASVIASFGITNTILASLIKRRKQIAIMKTIGASDVQILKLIFIQISMLILAGMALAIMVVGILVTYFSSMFQIVYDLPNIIVNLTIIYIVSVVFPIALAFRDILRISPVEALRE
ncbi:MAG: ABC transporter permease [Candidatus Micrarchaeota archaeon]|nr:ABC transporter permease [Candidatus Micrarchaeota archaeon]MCX8154392.1 ABC transporter permease [Candidatus Micrarchaeota archaeon]